MSICAFCGEQFRPRQAKQRFCSNRCTVKWQWDSGILTGVKRHARLVRPCEHCGATVESLPCQHRRFCSRACADNAKRGAWVGANNPRYNGGLCIHRGRAMVCCRDGSTLWYSRALMAAHLGRLLRSDEIVHHINGDGSDDRIENLQLTTRAEHIGIHRADLAAAANRKAAA